MSVGNGKQLNVLRAGRWIQHTINHRLNQQHAEGVEKSDTCKQEDGRDKLPRIRRQITQKSRQLADAALQKQQGISDDWPSGLSPGQKSHRCERMGIGCKAPFYLRARTRAGTDHVLACSSSAA